MVVTVTRVAAFWSRVSSSSLHSERVRPALRDAGCRVTVACAGHHGAVVHIQLGCCADVPHDVALGEGSRAVVVPGGGEIDGDDPPGGHDAPHGRGHLCERRAHGGAGKRRSARWTIADVDVDVQVQVAGGQVGGTEIEGGESTAESSRSRRSPGSTSRAPTRTTLDPGTGRSFSSLGSVRVPIPTACAAACPPGIPTGSWPRC